MGPARSVGSRACGLGCVEPPVRWRKQTSLELRQTGPAVYERQLFEQLIATYLTAQRESVRHPDLQLAAAVALQVAEARVHDTALRDPQRLGEDAFMAEVTDVLVRYLVREGS